MNRNELKGRIVAKGFKVEDFCKEIGMKRVTFDRRMKGQSEFTRDEIVQIVNVLDLSMDEMYSIFFTEKVA